MMFTHDHAAYTTRAPDDHESCTKRITKTALTRYQIPDTRFKSFKTLCPSQGTDWLETRHWTLLGLAREGVQHARD
jgi:hypothetical protein